MTWKDAVADSHSHRARRLTWLGRVVEMTAEGQAEIDETGFRRFRALSASEYPVHVNDHEDWTPV